MSEEIDFNHALDREDLLRLIEEERGRKPKRAKKADDACAFPGCTRLVGSHGARGMCFKHYMRKHEYKELTHLTEISDVDRGWFIGLFEGEGYISFSGKQTVQIGISMSDQDVIEKAYNIIGIGELYGPYPAPRSNKLMWTIKVCKSLDALGFLQWMLPHLGIRRSLRAEEAILRLKGGRSFAILNEEYAPAYNLRQAVNKESE